MSDGQANPVRRRRVFYIPGYDPFHPRRYRELYRKESTEQAALSGYDISQFAKTSSSGPYGWHVDATIDGQQVRTDIDVLFWSDLVKRSMNITIPAAYMLLLRTAWIYISTGALWRLMRLRKGPVIAALYPVGMLMLQPLLSFLLGWILGSLLAAVTFSGAQWIVVLPVFVMTMRWFKRNDRIFYAYYLMHDYTYSSGTRGANPVDLEARMRDFADTIAEALTGDEDEVLIVGHSYGAHIGVSILADLFRAGRVPDNGPTLSFLSLGHVVPMLSFLPEAHRLRADLNYMAQRKEVTWVDVTAPGDGCAFALCDPVSVSGVAPEEKHWPLVFSAAFSQTLSPERWKSVRWRFFHLHFQYLCAFDRPGDYDYFKITAGPLTLGERYQDRQPSKSRIETPLSGYTSMVA